MSITKTKNNSYRVRKKYPVDICQLLGLSNPNYDKMKVYQSGEIYTIGGSEKGNANDYFESGVVRADWVLKDYITIFHPEIFPKDGLKYMKRLK